MSWKICIVELTRFCPFACPNCYMRQRGNLNQKTNDGVLHMSLKEYTKMLDLFVDQGGSGIELLGGEPTYHPEFLEIVTRGLQSGLEVWIYTNLHRIGAGSHWASTLMDLRKLYNNRLFIVGKSSVPDLNDPEQKAIQAFTLGTDEHGIELLQQGLHAMHYAGWRKPFFGVENLLNYRNITWAPLLYEYGLETERFFVDCEWPTFPGKGANIAEYFRLLPTEKQLQEFVAAIQKIDGQHGLPVRQPVPPHLTGKNEDGVPQGCVAFKRGGLYVAVNGDIQLCSSGLPLTDETGKQFNIFDDPLEQILNNQTVIARRKSCEQSQILTGVCSNCSDFPRCLGGCAAFKEGYYGTPLVSYPMCPQKPWADDIRQTIEQLKGEKENV